uniref:Uncharacterized protein n=1 Tax=Anopheles culicifacies TaxID=139723 RepID=A0A182M7K1_9DIPT
MFASTTVNYSGIRPACTVSTTDGKILPKPLPIPAGLTMAMVHTTSSVATKIPAHVYRTEGSGSRSSSTSSRATVRTGGKANATNVTTTIIINSVTGTIECTTGNGGRSAGTVTINTHDHLPLDGRDGLASVRADAVEPVVYKILNAVKSNPPSRSNVDTGDTAATISTRYLLPNGECSTGQSGERAPYQSVPGNGTRVEGGGDGNGNRRCNTSITLPRSLGTVVGRGCAPPSKVNVFHTEPGTVAADDANASIVPSAAVSAGRASSAVKIITVPGGHYRDVLTPATTQTPTVPPSVTNVMGSSSSCKYSTATVPFKAAQQQQYQLRRELSVQQHPYLSTTPLHPTPNSSFSQPNLMNGDGIASVSTATTAAKAGSEPAASSADSSKPTL